MKIPTRLAAVFILSLLAASCMPQAIPTPQPTAAAAPTPAAPVQPQRWQPKLPAGKCTPTAARTCRVVFVLPERYYAASGRSYPDQFRDAGYTVSLASNAPQVVEICENTVRPAQPDKDIPVELSLAEVDVAEYDAIIYIGGLGCQDQWHDQTALHIAQQAAAQGKVLGAVGCGATILAYAGVLQGKTAAVCSGQPPVKHGQDYCAVLESQGAQCSSAFVERDGLIVTGKQRSPYFAAGVIEVILASTGG